jgi:hypothetical protein
MAEAVHVALIALNAGGIVQQPLPWIVPSDPIDMQAFTPSGVSQHTDFSVDPAAFEAALNSMYWRVETTSFIWVTLSAGQDAGSSDGGGGMMPTTPAAVGEGWLVTPGTPLMIVAVAGQVLAFIKEPKNVEETPAD